MFLLQNSGLHSGLEVMQRSWMGVVFERFLIDIKLTF